MTSPPSAETRTEEARRHPGATQRWLDDVVAIEDPETANRAITRAHFALSEMLDEVLGPYAGANFHTWAVWGSREAGITIARRDVPGLRGAIGAVSALIGFLGGVVLGDVVAAVITGVTLGLAAGLLTQVELDRARRNISHGNRIVLEEIGGATLRFISAVGHEAAPEALSAFLDGLEPGPTEDGGQELLRTAFSAYRAASYEADRERRHQLVFAANCFAVWHEHMRLQRDIARAMPRPLRRIITRTLLDFKVGPEQLHVGHDLAPLGAAAWPPTLRVLREPLARAAVAALRAPEREPDTLAGSAASSWASLPQRMDYVVDLFRSRHLAHSVFDPPYPKSVSVHVAHLSVVPADLDVRGRGQTLLPFGACRSVREELARERREVAVSEAEPQSNAVRVSRGGRQTGHLHVPP